MEDLVCTVSVCFAIVFVFVQFISSTQAQIHQVLPTKATVWIFLYHSILLAFCCDVSVYETMKKHRILDSPRQKMEGIQEHTHHLSSNMASIVRKHQEYFRAPVGLLGSWSRIKLISNLVSGAAEDGRGLLAIFF